jgi:glycosyltransferase involved in cell wall biosynthesis
MVALEAMASGRPVIASKVGGLAGMFTSDSAKLDEQAGILVPPDDVEQLSFAISTLIEDKDRMRDMGNAARIQALSFSWSERSQLLNELYREMSKT